MSLLDITDRPLAALDVVEKVARGLLVKVTVGCLHDFQLAPECGLLELATPLGNDLEAAIGGIKRSERSPQLQLGPST